MELPKRVLIISYYWPPSGGSGVQRWLKFTKYLPSFGWKPIVYTPSNPEIPIADTGLYKDIPEQAEILKQPIWEPYTVYKRFLGLKKSDRIQTGFLSEKKKNIWAENLSVWIRGNFFIPDARCFWIKPSVSYLSKWLKNNSVDAIISSGPPHSMHLIAYELRKQFNIPWIADFRDPWTKIDFYKDLKLTSWADSMHHKLEKKVVTTADALLVVGKSMKSDFEEITTKPIHVITNGYDADDFDTLPSPKDTRFSIVHVGSMVPSRNPIALFEALSELIHEDAGIERDLCIRLVGSVDISIVQTIENFGLQSFLERVEYLPHEEVITEQKRAAVLLLVLNKTFSAKRIVTGKLFEYIAANRPILAIGDENSDAAEIIRETGTGHIFDHNAKERIKKAIVNLYDDWKSGRDQQNNVGNERFSRESLTRDLVSLLHEITHV